MCKGSTYMHVYIYIYTPPIYLTSSIYSSQDTTKNYLYRGCRLEEVPGSILRTSCCCLALLVGCSERRSSYLSIYTYIYIYIELYKYIYIGFPINLVSDSTLCTASERNFTSYLIFSSPDGQPCRIPSSHRLLLPFHDPKSLNKLECQKCHAFVPLWD